jgi:V-type H+-transporting ATPase subunit a
VTPFQRSFVGEIRRIEEMARRVRFFAAQIERERDVVPIRPLYDSAPLIAVGPRAAQTMDDLDVTLSEHESRLLEMNSAYEVLSGRLAELIEARHVLRETAVFFQPRECPCPGHLIQHNSYSPPFRPNRVRARSALLLTIVLFPLLQHDDRENQYSTASTAQFDLEYVAFSSLLIRSYLLVRFIAGVIDRTRLAYL